jgi:hypothetical protein
LHVFAGFALTWLATLNLYDVNRPTLDLATFYGFRPNWALSFHFRNVFRSRSFGVGVQHRF